METAICQTNARCCDYSQVLYQIQVYPELVNVTLFGNIVFADVKMRSYWSRLDPNLMTSVLKRGKFRQRHTHREDDHVKIRDRTGVILPQTK